MAKNFDWTPYLDEGERVEWQNSYSAAKIISQSALAFLFLAVIAGMHFVRSASDPMIYRLFPMLALPFVLAYLGAAAVGLIQYHYAMTSTHFRSFAKAPWHRTKIESEELGKASARATQYYVVVRNAKGRKIASIALPKQEKPWLLATLKDRGVQVK